MNANFAAWAGQFVLSGNAGYAASAKKAWIE
jgi:hypothetical protein